MKRRETYLNQATLKQKALMAAEKEEQEKSESMEVTIDRAIDSAIDEAIGNAMKKGMAPPKPEELLEMAGGDLRMTHRSVQPTMLVFLTLL